LILLLAGPQVDELEAVYSHLLVDQSAPSGKASM